MTPIETTTTVPDTQYDEALAELCRELTPQGYLETSFVEEIMTATWRLRRCRILEAGSEPVEYASLDRARSHAHNIIRRSLAELRKLQTERTIRFEIDHAGFPGVAESRQILAAIRTQHLIQANAPGQLPPPKDDDCSALDAFLAQATRNMPRAVPEPASPNPASSFCKIPETAQPDSDPSTGPAPTPGDEQHLEAARQRHLRLPEAA